MNRKRLISILAATALSVAAFAGPAAALEGTDLSTEDETVTAEVGDTEVTLEADDDPALEVHSNEGNLSVDSGDEEQPVKTDDGASDPVEELGNEINKVLGDDKEPTNEPSDPPTSPKDDDVHTASGDTTVAPPPISAFDHGARNASLGSQSFRHFSYTTSYQRPAPSSAAPEVTQTEELEPVVAPPREETAETEPVELAATTPMSESGSTPAGLRLLATLIVAGTALTWWNAREAADAHN